MGLSIGAGFSVGSGFSYTPSITAVAGATTTVSATTNTAITSFSPFSSVQFGTTPYTYFVSVGTLPTGITINSSTGLVSGTPTVTYATASVTFSVRDAANEVAAITSTVSFTANAALSATAGATTTVSGYQNTAITSFNPFSSVSGGYTPYVYSVSSGTLPTGVTLNSSTGLVSGTPSATYATANVTFIVTDAQGTQASTTKTVSFTVNAALSATAGATTTVSATVNVAITSFNPFSSVTGGYTPYTYYVSTGTLPAGVTINSSTGLVSGTPTNAYSSSNVTFSVKDVNNVVAGNVSTVNFTVTPVTYSATYLIVAGGGGGGSGYGTASGGGGGGGVVTGTMTLTGGVVYTITRGSGGAGGTWPGTAPSNGIGVPGTQGTPSTITAPTPVSITAIGGGYGSSFINPPPYLPGGPGGSGGGGNKYSYNPVPAYPALTYPPLNATQSAQTQTLPPGGTYTNYGNPGGVGYLDGQPSATGGGGGGGAGKIGNSGPNNWYTCYPGQPATRSQGGAGIASSITGTSIYYGGGGGGSNGPYPWSGSPGGLGGGGSGGFSSGFPTVTPVPTWQAAIGIGNGGPLGFGLAGTGGGGGGDSNWNSDGAGTYSVRGGTGGSGNIIISVPTPNFPGPASAPGATVTTPASAPGQTVLIYTTSGSYTA